MALGYPARAAQGMADTVHSMGFCYTKGMLYLIGFTTHNAIGMAAKLWAKAWAELLDIEA